MIKQLSLLLSVVTAVSAYALAPAAMAQDEPVIEEDGRNCINLRRIRSTKIIDDRNILFYVAGKEVYHNILPSACSGLARQDRFSYQTHSGSLCNTDRIAVLFDDAFGLREGHSCRLGLFHRTTEEDAKAIIEQLKEPPRAQPVPLPDPQTLGDEAPTAPEES